jgi:hypothetical protein
MVKIKRIFNIIYLTIEFMMVIMYYNFFYDFITVNINLPRFLSNILGIIVLIPWSLFYLMSLTFTILIHPLILMVFIIKHIKNDKKYIEETIYFILSLLMAIMYLYIIWGKGYILTV